VNIVDDFIRGNPRIRIISNGGRPTPVPTAWRPILGASDFMIGIPDMHMFLYHSPMDNFRHGAEALYDLLVHLSCLQAGLSKANQRMRVYQLGDLFELRYRNPDTGRPVTPRDIRESHPYYNLILRLFAELDTRIVLGNHDYELRHDPNVVPVAREGDVHLEHGYAADHWYRFTNPVRPFWASAMNLLAQFRRAEASVNTVRRLLRTHGEDESHMIGLYDNQTERVEMPLAAGYPTHCLRYYDKLVRRSGRGETPRLVVVAHTHHAYLDPSFAGGRAIFVDAGAWTEGRSDFMVATNEEVAVCRYCRRTTAARTLTYRRAG